MLYIALQIMLMLIVGYSRNAIITISDAVELFSYSVDGLSEVSRRSLPRLEGVEGQQR